MTKSKAVVKWFNNDKGFGFLVDSVGRDVFVHHKNLIMGGYRTLLVDQEVEYLPVQTDKGVAAAEVTLVGAQPSIIVIPHDVQAAAKILREKFSADELELLMDEIELAVS